MNSNKVPTQLLINNSCDFQRLKFRLVFQALLKINRIMAGRLLQQPPRYLMPTTDELKSFRLEMCTPPRPAHITGCKCM